MERRDYSNIIQIFDVCGAWTLSQFAWNIGHMGGFKKLHSRQHKKSNLPRFRLFAHMSL